MSDNEQIEEIKKEIINVARNFNPKEVWLFGSLLEEGFEKARDIDIAVKGIDKDFFKLYGKLIWILEAKFHKRVDLIPIDWLRGKRIFLKHIRAGIQLI